MSKRRIWLLVALVVCIAATLAVALAVAGSGNPAAAATSAQPNAPTTNFDASIQPSNVYPTYFVSGSDYQMGYQYGQEAKDLIVHNVCVARANALAEFHSWDAVLAAIQADTAIVAAKTPNELQIWHGIADGAGVSYDEVRLLNMGFLPPPACSTICAWGGATKDHTLIAGANLDSPGWIAGNMYGCVLVAYPSDGNAFIDCPAQAGVMSCSRGMNDKGLVALGSGGQQARPQDNGAGYPGFPAASYVLQHCDNVAQAESLLLSLPAGGGSLMNLVDTGGHACVIEQTAAAHAVRKPGDFGERDYLMGGNIFLTKTMQPAMDPNQLQDGDLDDWYRYYTEQKLIKQDWGSLTTGTLASILGCHNYFGTRDPVTGAVDTTRPQTWHYDVLNTQPASDPMSEWTPGMRAMYFTPTLRTLYEPAAKTVYVLTGNDDPLFSWNPNATGEFCKLVLADNPTDVTSEAEADAQLQTWYGAVALHRSSHPSQAHLTELNEAKADIAKGMNLQVQAGIAADPSDAQSLLGQATTCFCEAQCYAEQAQGLVSNSGALPPSS